jgi:NAD(P)-dependent dehydrogenase (short-subunit alcohol dehydrogenase family)
MNGKVLVYGGSGIAAATARQLHAKGIHLHLAGRNETHLTALAQELQSTFTVGDVTDSTFFQQATHACGDSLTGLVYAIGSINLKPLARLNETDFLQDLRLNAIGAALAVQAALPLLKKHTATAAVVLFSSVAARQGFALHASIGMAKAAVEGLTLSLAAELAPKIRVNAIAPSLTRTPLAAKLLANSAMAESIAQLHPLPRLGEPQELAALATFLLSSEADWITGQIIGVDGGRSSLRVKG